MASTEEYKQFLLDQLSDLDIRVRPMMGEYLLYYKGVYMACICDNRLLVKPSKDNARFSLKEEFPYEGGKSMYLVEELDNREYLRELFDATLEGLR